MLFKAMVESAIRDNYGYPYAAAFPMSGAEGVSLKTAFNVTDLGDRLCVRS